MSAPRRASGRLIIVVVGLLALGLGVAHAEKPLVPVNAGQAWRVYDASNKEIGRLVLGQQDPKTGQIQYSTIDPATGTAQETKWALPWELRDIISAEIAKGDHAVGGYYLDRAHMNFSPTVTLKAADLPKPPAAAEGGSSGAPAPEGAAPGPESGKAPAPKGKGRGKAREKGAGPGGREAESAAPGPGGEAAPGPGKGGPAAGSGPAGPGGEAAPPPEKGKGKGGAKGAGPGGPGGETAPAEEAPAEEGGGKLPLIPIAGGVGALVIIVLLVTLLKKRKSVPTE